MRHRVLLVVVLCSCATVSSRTREAMRAEGSTEMLTSTPPGERITPADDGLARARLFAVGAVQALARQALLFAPDADGKVQVNAETYGLDVGFFLAAAVNERLVEQGLAAATWAPKVKVRFEGGVERLPEAVPVTRAGAAPAARASHAQRRGADSLRGDVVVLRRPSLRAAHHV